MTISRDELLDAINKIEKLEAQVRAAEMRTDTLREALESIVDDHLISEIIANGLTSPGLSDKSTTAKLIAARAALARGRE